MSTPWSSRSLSSPGKREFRAIYGRGLFIYLFSLLLKIMETSFNVKCQNFALVALRSAILKFTRGENAELKGSDPTL